MVKTLEDTPAVLSLGKLCEAPEYTYEWFSGEQPRLTHQVRPRDQQQSEVTIGQQETGAIHTKLKTKRDNDEASGDRLRDFPKSV